MPARLYGIEHFTYIGITAAIAVAGLLLAKKYAKSEKAIELVLRQERIIRTSFKEINFT